MAYYGKKRIRIKPRFFVIVGATLFLLIWGVVSLIRAITGVSVEWGGLETDRNVTAIVIRDENVIRSQEYARMNCLVAEGEVVEAGEPVAELYTSDYSEKDLQNLISLQKTIKEYQQNNILKNIVDATLEDYNARISAKLEEISQAADSTRVQNLLVLEHELSALMTERQNYMRQIVTPDDALNSLYQQEADLQTKISANKQVIGLTESSAVSFFMDGYEESLNANRLDTLTVKMIEQVCKEITSYGDSLTQSNGPMNANAPLLRAVNNNLWYLVYTMPARENTLVEGTTCELTLEGYNDDEDLITATVHSVKREGSNVLVVLRVEHPVGAMMRLRKISVHIGRNAEGFKVPLKAVRDGNTVRVITGEGQVDVPVEVVASNSRYAIIRQSDGGAALALNQRLVMP